ncbi:hypothetical protein WN943_016288 [Citrus x changshan-huyou]
MDVKDRGMPMQTNSASENIVELRPIFLPTVKGIHIRTLKELIERLDEANKIFKVTWFL